MNNLEYHRALKPAEILMLSYADKFHTGTNTFQQFWKYRYNANPDEILKYLHSNDFIELDTIKNALKRKSLNELKIILSENNLKVSGRKDELIDRIVTVLDDEQISKYIPERYYSITPLGQEVLDNCPNIIFIHRHPEFDLSIYDVPLSHDIYDFITATISARESEYMYYNNWGLYRNCKLHRAKLAKLQGDNISAISYLLEVCYLDISELRNGVEPKEIQKIKNYILDVRDDPTKALANGIISEINILSKKMGLSYDDISNMCHNVISKVNLPFHIYSDDEAENIILQRIYGTLRFSVPTNDAAI